MPMVCANNLISLVDSFPFFAHTAQLSSLEGILASLWKIVEESSIILIGELLHKPLSVIMMQDKVPPRR